MARANRLVSGFLLLVAAVPLPAETQYVVSTYAGGRAPAPQIQPDGVAADNAGNLFIGDGDAHRVWKVSPDGAVTTVAGNGSYGFSGDGSDAIDAQLRRPIGVAVDSAGNLYIADNLEYYLLAESSSRVRKVTPGSIITTAVGCTGGVDACYNADEGPAHSSHLAWVPALTVDSAGNLYVIDIGDGGPGYQWCQIHKVTPDGFLNTVIASGSDGSLCGYFGDGEPAAGARISFPTGIALDTIGNLYIADTGNHRVRKVTPDGVITTIAGNGIAGYSGDGGPATNAQLSAAGVVVDSDGNLYISDIESHRVRKVTADGMITTIAGDGSPGYEGDGGPATNARLNRPSGLTVDTAGNVYVADYGNHAVRILRPAGNGSAETLRPVRTLEPTQ